MRALLLFCLLIPFSYSLSCPPEYMLVGGVKCLKAFWTPARHWEAERNCTAYSGTLVTIKNAIDNRLVYNFAKDSGFSTTWIGLFCFDNTTSSCYWDDGSGTPVYQNFEDSSSYSLRWKSMIMLIPAGPNQGKWRSFSPPNSISYICEAPTSVDNPNLMFCNNYNGFCYWPEQINNSSLPQNLTMAAYYCSVALGGNLTSIHSKMELDYIKNLYKSTYVNTIYLGAMADSNGRFQWMDGTPWDFDYMDPLNFQKGKCLVMDVKGDGLWSQVDCDQKLAWMCKRDIRAQPTQAPPEIQEVSEPENLFDASYCNSTLYMAPGSISSFGYPNYSTPPSYCTWRIVALGPYRMGVYFDFWATNGKLTIYDDVGNNIGQFMGIYDRTPFAKYSPYNIATVTFEPRPQSGVVDRGFHAVILPL